MEKLQQKQLSPADEADLNISITTVESHREEAKCPSKKIDRQQDSETTRDKGKNGGKENTKPDRGTLLQGTVGCVQGEILVPSQSAVEARPRGRNLSVNRAEKADKADRYLVRAALKGR